MGEGAEPSRRCQLNCAAEKKAIITTAALTIDGGVFALLLRFGFSYRQTGSHALD